MFDVKGVTSLMTTVISKIKKGKAIFLSKNVLIFYKCACLFTFYIAGKYDDE